MKELIIEFTRPRGHKLPIVSWLIRLFEQTSYSHVRVRWVNTTGVNLVYEASGGEVKFLGPYAQSRAEVDIIASCAFVIDQEQYKKLITTCMTYAGIKYSSKQLFGLFLMRLFNLKRNPFRDDFRGQVCTELVARICDRVLDMQLNIDYDTAGLKELYKKIITKE